MSYPYPPPQGQGAYPTPYNSKYETFKKEWKLDNWC